MKKISCPAFEVFPVHAWPWPVVLLGLVLLLSLSPPPLEARLFKPTSPPKTRLSFVPALLTPYDKIVVPSAKATAGSLGWPSTEKEDVVTLDGVSPPQSLDALRRAPQANIALVPRLSVKTIKDAEALGASVTLIQLQNEVAEADLKHLWQATIERNEVVRFALEKIALPPERHMTHSSEFLRKTLSVLITGAALASSTVAPIGGYESMGVMTGSQVAQNFVMGRNKPISDLSPTEHIQLSYLIDDLKESLVEEYHRYQAALIMLNQLQNEQAREEAHFQKFQADHDPTQRFLAIQRYYKFRAQLQKVETQAQDARIQLERIAGANAVDTLAIGIRPHASHVVLETPVVKKEVAQSRVFQSETPRVLTPPKSPQSQPNGENPALPLMEDAAL
ncbi:MAG: hypothetical protein HEQ32_03095 [Vampirovibrio sp.]